MITLITDLQAMDELREEVEFLNAVLTAARIGPWEFYPGLGAICLSPQWVELFGVDDPPERFTDYLTLIDPQDRARVVRETLRAFITEGADHWESRHRLAGRLVISRAVAVRPGRVIGADIDVT